MACCSLSNANAGTNATSADSTPAPQRVRQADTWPETNQGCCCCYNNQGCCYCWMCAVGQCVMQLPSISQLPCRAHAATSSTNYYKPLYQQFIIILHKKSTTSHDDPSTSPTLLPRPSTSATPRHMLLQWRCCVTSYQHTRRQNDGFCILHIIIAYTPSCVDIQ